MRHKISLVRLFTVEKLFRINYLYDKDGNGRDAISYLVSVPIRGDAFVGDAHAEASYASKLICGGQIKGIRLTLVASETRCVLLKKEILENTRYASRVLLLQRSFLFWTSIYIFLHT